MKVTRKILGLTEICWYAKNDQVVRNIHVAK